MLAELRSNLLGDLCRYVQGSSSWVFENTGPNPNLAQLLAIRVCLPHVLSAQVARGKAWDRWEWQQCLTALIQLPASPAAIEDTAEAADYVASCLLEHLGIKEGIELKGLAAHPIRLCNTIEDFCEFASNYCELAHPTVPSPVGELILSQTGRASQAACLSLMHGRPLQAARVARWWAISAEDDTGSELRRRFLQNLRRFTESSREIEFHLTIADRYVAY